MSWQTVYLFNTGEKRMNKLETDIIESMAGLNCENCKFFHELKLFKSAQPPIEFEIRSCCTMFPETEPGYDAFVLEVFKDEVCEMFTKKEEEDGKDI